MTEEIKPGYVRVTDMLKALGLSNYDARWYTEEARDRGSNLHACLALLVEDDLDMDSVDPSILPEVEAVKSFLENLKIKPIWIERRLYSTLGYCGKPDLFAKMGDGSYCVFDWKRGVAHGATRFQLAFYAMLICESQKDCGPIFSEGVKRFAIDRIGCGRPTVVPYTDRNDIKVARSMIAVYNGARNAGIFHG